jgi:TetR/AcrR family fatty acid metabolism transcriptional regulator
MEGSERRTGNGEKRSERRAEKRLAILEGAVRVFAEKGFFNTTVAEIARSAGVADGTIYLYFKSKDDLLLSIFDEKMQELCTLARAAIAGETSAIEALRKVCIVHLSAVEANPALAAVLIVELRQSNAFVRDVEKPRLVEYLDLLSEIVRRGQSSGEFRSDVHPAAVKRALFGALDEIALGWLLARRKFDLSRTAHEMADMFVRGLTIAAPVTAPRDPVVQPQQPTFPSASGGQREDPGHHQEG